MTYPGYLLYRNKICQDYESLDEQENGHMYSNDYTDGGGVHYKLNAALRPYNQIKRGHKTSCENHMTEN